MNYKLFSRECEGNGGGEGKEEKRENGNKREGTWIIRPLHAKTIELKTFSNMNTCQ
jgi:hypothetical protein